MKSDPGLPSRQPTPFQIIAFAMCLLLMVFTFSCKKESSSSTQYTIPSNLKMISSGYAQGAATKVVIYAAEDLYVGYNKLYIALYDSVSNVRITQSQVSLSSLSAAGLTAPVENPPATAVNGLFTAAVVLPSAGAWTLTAGIRNAGGHMAGFAALVNAAQVTPAKSYSVTLSDSSNLFVSIVQPANPQLGVNNFELVVDKQVNSLTYAADSTYMIAINPIMPAMTGMNSPNNVNPNYTGEGHYVGKVDFIMSGGWQVYVDILHNGVASDTSHYFSLNL